MLWVWSAWDFRYSVTPCRQVLASMASLGWTSSAALTWPSIFALAVEPFLTMSAPPALARARSSTRQARQAARVFERVVLSPPAISKCRLFTPRRCRLYLYHFSYND